MNRSSNYVMSAHTECAGDMLEIETVRKTVKAINASARAGYKNRKQYLEWIGSDVEPESPTQYYVKCQARGPRAKFAKALGKHPRAFDQSLPLKFAERMDVYVYQR
jgi:hypothetical protein